MATLLSSIRDQARLHLKEDSRLSQPATPTVAAQGTTGATSYGYKVVAMNRQGTTEASTEGTVADGNATLSSSNFNRITWTAVTSATAYRIYRTTGAATQGLIGTVGQVTTFDDTGLTGDSSTAPSTNTSGGRFWSDAELLDIIINGAKDLWGAVVDLNQEHHQTVDTSNVTLAADGTTLTGVPSDVFRITLIEPADTTSSSATRKVLFRPADYNSYEFINARAQSAQEVGDGLVIYYSVSQAGAPVGAPTILVAPAITTTMSLRFVYVPVLGTLTAASNNPIGGESDAALIAYCVAFARAKEREDRAPDPFWLSVYATEKQNVLVRMTPRQTQEPEIVEGIFEQYW